MGPEEQAEAGPDGPSPEPACCCCCQSCTRSTRRRSLSFRNRDFLPATCTAGLAAPDPLPLPPPLPPPPPLEDLEEPCRVRWWPQPLEVRFEEGAILPGGRRRRSERM